MDEVAHEMYTFTMENNLEQQNNSNEEIKIVDGIKYKKVDSGFTIREYYSHTSPDPKNPHEMRPGPGWDFRWNVLEKYKVRKVEDLPDEPYYQWEPVDEE
jgi:hypothetical protein